MHVVCAGTDNELAATGHIDEVASPKKKLKAEVKAQMTSKPPTHAAVEARHKVKAGA